MGARMGLDAHHAALFSERPGRRPTLKDGEAPVRGRHFYDHVVWGSDEALAKDDVVVDAPGKGDVMCSVYVYRAWRPADPVMRGVPLLRCNDSQEVEGVHLVFSSPLLEPTTLCVRRGLTLTRSDLSAGTVSVDLSMHDVIQARDGVHAIEFGFKPEPAGISAALKSRFVSIPSPAAHTAAEKRAVCAALRAWYIEGERALPVGVTLARDRMDAALAEYEARAAIRVGEVASNVWAFATSSYMFVLGLAACRWQRAYDCESALLQLVADNSPGQSCRGVAYRSMHDVTSDDTVRVNISVCDLFCGIRLHPPVDADALVLYFGGSEIHLQVRRGVVHFSYPVLAMLMTFMPEVELRMPGLSAYTVELELVVLSTEMRQMVFAAAAAEEAGDEQHQGERLDDGHLEVDMPAEGVRVVYMSGVYGIKHRTV
jgi:hypothetical protein